jgi:hypothetical protein
MAFSDRTSVPRGDRDTLPVRPRSSSPRVDRGRFSAEGVARRKLSCFQCQCIITTPTMNRVMPHQPVSGSYRVAVKSPRCQAPLW